MSENLFTEKKKYSKLLKSQFWFKTKNKAIGLIVLKEDIDIVSLLFWLSVLPCDFVFLSDSEISNQSSNICISKEVKNDLLLWFDFILTDNKLDSLKNYIKNSITPLVPTNNHLSWVLREFDPINVEWNSYLYDDKNIWSMFYAVSRYLENYKFPYDNRNLVKNLINL